MEAYLRERLDERTWQNRLICLDDCCFMEFSALDVDRLSRLGIGVDALGPRLVVCMWNAKSPLEIGGYLVVDNLAMGRPSIGGIRMMPDVTPSSIYGLARCMTLKNAAANLPFGGGKVGIVADRHLTPEMHSQVVRGFAPLLRRYTDVFLPGPDVGTDDADMRTIAIENGLDTALSKPMDMGGSRVDEVGAAAGGLVIALEALLEEMPRLTALPQFASLKLPYPSQLTVLIQGFGAVGSNSARILRERIPSAKVVGVSDIQGYLYSEEGLPVKTLLRLREERGHITRFYYQEHMLSPVGMIHPTKYSTEANDLLRESAFCLIPATPIAHYLDSDPSTRPAMTVDRMGRWAVIIEGANTYSPDPIRQAARARMEREVYRQRGVLIVTDYLVNSGGVIFAAQEQMIKTPGYLRIPAEIFGNRPAVEGWCQEHAKELAELADKRQQAGELQREEIIRRNMRELVDLLIADPDLLPAEAAETITIRRIASRERDRRAAEIMVALPTIPALSTVRQAAERLVEAGSPILAVLDEKDVLTGVVTDWDITRASALGCPDDQPLEEIMTREVVSAAPGETIIDMIRKLERYEITAMPVVENGCVQGMVTADLLARKSLLRLLQSQVD